MNTNPSIDGFNVVVRRTNRNGVVETVPAHIVQYEQDRILSRRIFLRMSAQDKEREIAKQTAWVEKLGGMKTISSKATIPSKIASVPMNVPLQICDSCHHNIRFCKCYKWGNRRFTPR
jgi:hypothetical protein